MKRTYLDAILSVSAGCVLCLGCADSQQGALSGWNGAQAIHDVGFDDPPPSEQHLRIVAMQDTPNVCSFLEEVRDREQFGVDYLGVYVRDVRAGSHVVVPISSDDRPTARVLLVRAMDSARGVLGLPAQSGTVTVAFDRVDGPVRVAIDVAINPQTALPLMCVSNAESSAQTCQCQREDGSMFECTHSDSKEEACCVTDDPETVPLRAAFTAMPCAVD